MVKRTFLEKGIPEDRLFINPYGVDFDFWSAGGDCKEREKAPFTFLWVAALMVKYRDFRFIVPFAVQFGLYISPVGFYSTVVPQQWRLLYSLNPMVGVIDGFRWCLLGGENAIYWPGLALSVFCVVGILTTCIWYFRRTERTFALVI
jgi:ABC-type polysaccharide/polyol phosphate export permease